MTSSSYLKLGFIAAIFIFLPFLTGILIGRVNDSLLTDNKSHQPISALTSPKKITTREPTTQVILTEPAPTPAPEPEPEPVSSQVTPTPTKPKPTPPTKSTVAGITTSTAKTEPIVTCNGGLQQKFLCLLNDYRSKQNLGKLIIDNKLSSVALSHSQWMNETGNFSHTGINSSRMFDRCAAAGTQCLAENLAQGILDPDKLLSSWIANPSHNKNLLGNYSLVGFGQNGDYVTLLLN